VGGFRPVVREGVKERNNMLTPRVGGRKGRYMSQQLDLISCCLGVASRRFDNFESGMALHTIEKSPTELTQDMV